MAELGPTLYTTFFMLFFPMLALGTLAFRYAFFLNAARLAADAGAKCDTFLTDTSSSDISAVHTAQLVANTSCAGFKGVTLTSTTTYIVTTPMGGTPSKQTTPLSQPANSSTNAYNIEVVLTGQIAPLIAVRGFFGSAPGLTGPITTSVRSDVFFENTQGLNK